MSTPHSKRHRRLGAITATIGLTATAFAVGAVSLPLAEAAGSVASSVVTVDPARALDTRSATGLSGPVLANKSVKLSVTGAIPTRVGTDDVTQTIVPEGATGVLLNVTAVRPDARGFISIRPGTASGEPSSSNLNVQVGLAVPNAVTVALPTTGADAGTIDIWYGTGSAGARTDMLIDIVGYTTELSGGSGTPGPTGPAGPRDPPEPREQQEPTPPRRTTSSGSPRPVATTRNSAMRSQRAAPAPSSEWPRAPTPRRRPWS